MEPWPEFLIAFGRVLDRCLPQAILNAWSTWTNRTSFYASDVLRAVAKEELNLEYGTKEFLNIDHVFRDSCRIPRVFIESENKVTTAEEEIWKLCAVSCPLRVLLTVVEWDLNQEIWTPSHASQQKVLLPQWGKIAADHHKVWPTPSSLALLVGELCDPVKYGRPTHKEFQYYRFRFYAHHFDTSIGKWHADGIYQRYLAGPNQDENGQRLEGWPC